MSCDGMREIQIDTPASVGRFLHAFQPQPMTTYLDSMFPPNQVGLHFLCQNQHQYSRKTSGNQFTRCIRFKTPQWPSTWRWIDRVIACCKGPVSGKSSSGPEIPSNMPPSWTDTRLVSAALLKSHPLMPPELYATIRQMQWQCTDSQAVFCPFCSLNPLPASPISERRLC